jgi:hypothetical protein
MANRLSDAVSPYLRSHADNPVDWWQWGSDAFAEAVQRDVPVFLSIGYSTCHWCHVMARESFSDPELAAYLDENFVSIKVDREEHPDVDASYLAAASAFTDQLGWPLSVFTTPTGRAFFAGTYFPPKQGNGLPSFRDVLEAIVDAWRERRDDVEDTSARLAAALSTATTGAAGSLPAPGDFSVVIDELLEFEDVEHGGFGGAPKFPVAPVLGFLIDRADAGDERAGALARRTLAAMAASPLRNAVDGGFFRYATRADWSEPHYERMLYDNALLLDAYSRIGDHATADGIASFLLGTLRLPSGGFASAQDSESAVDGVRVEGGYYSLTAQERTAQPAPALDAKVLTGWNGLAIGALAAAGLRLGRREWIDAAGAAADLVAADPIIRARIDDRESSAVATLEDYGMLANGLVDLAIATGEVSFATRARELVDAAHTGTGFAAPGGADPVLVKHGLALENDPSEGAYPSGISAICRAAVRLAQLGAAASLRETATQVLGPIAALALPRPISFGGALGVMSLLAEPARQLVVVSEDRGSDVVDTALSWRGGLVVVVTSAQALAFARAGFELFESRDTTDGKATAYLCENFVCQLPVTDATKLAELIAGG